MAAIKALGPAMKKPLISVIIVIEYPDWTHKRE
jgi:hypothetical protein